MTHAEAPSSFRLALSPILPWPLFLVAVVAVVGLTLLVYRDRLRGSSSRWRWLALALRLAAILLCLLAAARPTVVLLQKVKQTATLVFLLDDSASMRINDEVGGKTRIDVARKTLADGRKAAEAFGKDLEIKTYRFDETLKDLKPDDHSEPKGAQTALGTSLSETIKRLQGTKLVGVVLLTDGANNAGLPPLAAAQRLRALQVPVLPVGFGSDSVGENSRDVAVRGLDAAPTVFIKNELQVRGTLRVRGYAGQTLEVELYAEGDSQPVATRKIKAPEGSEVVAIKDLKWIPKQVGERRLTLKVKPKPGELLLANNAMSTYVQVKSGGVSVLFIKGANFSWERRYLIRTLDRAEEIQVDDVELRGPVRGGSGALKDADLASGYNVFILCDLPSDFLTSFQQKQMARAVENGAGLLMLGGRSSFGPGGWANTPVGDLLPVKVQPGDGQLEPPGGLKAVVNPNGLEGYLLKLGGTREETAKIWAALPPIPGANVLGRPKPSAFVLAQATPGNQPLMVGHEVDKARVLAFAGETWPWARASDLTREAHRKFWRQVILWLAHQEDKGETQVRLTLDRRRAAVGQKIDLKVSTQDAKNDPIPDVTYETTVEPVATPGKSERIDMYNQGGDGHGSLFAKGEPGEYRVTAKALKNGETIGTDSARFDLYRDDRELENPAADLALLKQIAELTNGKYLPPEQLAKHLRSMDPSAIIDTLQHREHRLWDNWPFFLLFTALLSAEWFLRKRLGWV